ncbi:piwi-like protein Siwi [Diabrotica undecimpunctata]|uniref:piwi-like protein Siwi n=1 Tax=Diabrotica undecimpunctata TaxID=50387 RepID=UPI003B631B59
MESRGGKGRARGRARGAPQGGGAPGGPRPGPGQGPGAHGPPQQNRPPGDPWNRAAAPAPQQAPPAAQMGPWVRPQMPAPVVGAGRGSRYGGGETGELSAPVEHVRAIQGDGDGEKARATSSGVRGRNLKYEIIRTRPADLQTKKGTTGAPINLISNYFPLIQAGKFLLFQYRVDFNPDVDHTGARKKFMHQALRDTLSGYLFDGTVLYTAQRISPDPLEKFVENEAGERIRIHIRMVSELAWGDFHYIQLFNILIRKCLSAMKLTLLQRDYYDPQSQINIHEHKLSLWPGYFTSIRQHENQVMMNIELAFKVLREDTCYNMFLECRGPEPRKEFQSKIIGSSVLTFYNNRTYRIDDVDFSQNADSTFPLRDGSQMSYAQYYADKYKINIRERRQPLLVSRSKPREIRAGMPEVVYLIPELCKLTGLSDRMRENFKLMQALADHTRVGPVDRMRKLQDFCKRFLGCPEAVTELRKWDFQLADRLIQFQGRVLPMETIVAANNARYPAGPKADWTRDLRAQRMFNSANMTRLVTICPSRQKNECFDFLQTLQKAARGMQWDIGQPQIYDIPDDRTNTFCNAIENVAAKMDPTLIMCVLPTNQADRYGSIKKKCYVDRGIPSQIVLRKNLTSKGVMSIATKVAIQLNCKIGGAPWSIVMPLSNVMVVGYDVCRDTLKKQSSFAAMVATLDRAMTRYYNHVCEHQLQEELSENISVFLIVACQKYKEVNGRYPERILIYRDGVGDGQLPFVFTMEVERIKEKLTNEIYKNGDLKMSFIVVSKRINTRFFTPNSNPPPGTVVDDVVTLPERFDFFVVSQCVNQGTVAPTSYNVLSDNMGLSPDRLQMLTYKLCHMYYNWSGTVRVPAPCQYAHKLAFMTAQHLHRPANRALETLLYYL